MTTLTFKTTTLSVINKNNHTFLTSNDLGTALEYANPLQAINKLYNSNADEFTAEMTALIELQTAGGKQQVRVFSLRGAHLIAMFARTKVAKEFRKWVLDIIDREISQNEQQQLALPEPEPTIILELTQSEVRKLINVWMLFTRFAESVQFLLNKVKPFIVGHLYSSPELNLMWTRQAIKDTQPLIKKLMDTLPKKQPLHYNRDKLQRYSDF